MGLLALGACRQDPRPSHEPVAATGSQELIIEATHFTGSTLGTKQLILTFDDGPGPLSVTGALSTWLKNRPKPIAATFFVNGSCIASTTLGNPNCSTPTPNAGAILQQLKNDGHLVGNHTTTHRDLTTVPDAELAPELADTDALISPYVPWNRFVFRPPYGSWDDAVYQKLSLSPMNKYVGPIYWNIGGGPTDQSASATQAADWECWDLGYTTKQCGDRYLSEVRALGKGIVLMHDPFGDTSNHNPTSGTGNTVDMVKYIVPILESEGYTFKALHEDPEIALALPSCNAACATCSGPNANHCTSCSGGKYLSAGTCTTCSTCGASSYRSAACSASANTVCTTCTTCSAGMYRSSPCTATTDAVCAPCAPGTFSSAPGATTCTACAPGSYASTEGASACTSCEGCDDEDPCTTDTCSPTTGCSHVAISGCGSPESTGDAGGPGGAEPPQSSGPTNEISSTERPPQPSPAPEGGGGCSASGAGALLPSSSFGWAWAAMLVRRRRRPAAS